MVLRARPELLHETLRDAKMIAEALDGVWTHLDRIVRNARRKSAPGGSTASLRPVGGMPRVGRPAIMGRAAAQ